MSEYTSTLEGFQRAMEWSLTGPPEEAHVYAESILMPTFYHTNNGKRRPYNDFVNNIAGWRDMISQFKLIVDEFLRDGDRLAAHMMTTIDIDGVISSIESFIFGKVDKESGKLEWMIERSIWGETGQALRRGVS
ncbi:hypothetical protein F4803DRAFT_303899 [Xylaria telfairii]|nr:hypothetical protein F4803DRAFT_303899 [Xylaria telfairii]